MQLARLKVLAMAPLRVGVLTFHRCINYGSYWQARCLVEGLRARGHNAVILDHDSHRIKSAELRCAIQPVLPTITPKSDIPVYRRKILQFFEAIDSLPLSRRFSLDNPDEMEGCDVVVVGSDEVWNLFHPWYGQCAAFYGDRIKAHRLISYAASFGNYPASLGLEQTWAEKLKAFNFISVRDSNSQILIESSLGVKAEIVLDPCLQFLDGQGEETFQNQENAYIAVYGHNFSDSFVHEICRWAERKRVELISIGYRNDWAHKQWIAAGPHDFRRFMARCEAVATNFFHGCIFALRNAKPFACEATYYRKNKLLGLLSKIGGEKHLLTEHTSRAVYSTCMGEPLNRKILTNIERLRQSSNAYLDRSLEAVYA
jgi:hypothetical protein